MSITMSDFDKIISTATKIVPTGAFLTVKNHEKTNAMTIGWASFGFKWGIPVVDVLVRESRFTKHMLDEALEFSLSFPTDNSMKESLSFCGQKSGRDTDKILDCELEIIQGKELNVPVVSCKGIVMECKVVATFEMKESLTDSDLLDKWYKNGDLHTIYTAQVVSCYETI